VAVARPLWSEAGDGVRRPALDGDLEVDVAVEPGPHEVLAAQQVARGDAGGVLEVGAAEGFDLAEHGGSVVDGEAGPQAAGGLAAALDGAVGEGDRPPDRYPKCC
jgi:hypothetical protein